MAECIERHAVKEYYVIRDKNTGLYFRGKGANRWGKYYNQATIYRVKGTAEHTIKSIAWTGGEEAEVVQIQIVESAADVVEVRHGRWLSNPHTDELICSECDGIAPVDCEKEDFYESNYCPNCGAKMDGKGG